MNLYQAKSQFSKVARLVKSGDTVILCERNRPFAEIRPLPGIGKPKKRKLGLMQGLCPMGADFFESDSEVADLFNNGLVFPSSPPPGKP